MKFCENRIEHLQCMTCFKSVQETEFLISCTPTDHREIMPVGTAKYLYISLNYCFNCLDYFCFKGLTATGQPS